MQNDATGSNGGKARKGTLFLFIGIALVLLISLTALAVGASQGARAGHPADHESPADMGPTASPDHHGGRDHSAPASHHPTVPPRAV
jgi:hypothetical protein